MHHSKDQVFTFIMMLICSRCTVSINNYSTLHMLEWRQVMSIQYLKLNAEFL